MGRLHQVQETVLKGLEPDNVALVATGLALGFGGAAQAGGYGYGHGYQPTCYKTVTTYVTKKVYYTVAVTRYDECGTPITIYEYRCRYVEVPVLTRVACASYGY